ncbi:ABC transporter substrate-binding protein [Paenibacillus ginsengarvi]|uniref:Extracellular solute-binding protein n=1 Tax=Paenibacillus ginsengarvi TaxID=400777 RepID=A0A3B0C8W4_9BACL|nr:extracellular solute-binding protein [Paenibacillus ginsengarvi]RKN82252.1 extracellular solute-binding protein [Paenibacillus ginsengarvi]
MAKRKVALLMISSALVAGLVGCSGGGGTSSDGNEKSGEPVKAPAVTNEPVELSIVTNAGHSQEAFDSRFGNAIRKKFPNYTIKFIPNSAVKFTDLVATNTMVDIVYAAVNDFTSGPLKSGMVYDMTELMKKHNVDPNKVGMNWVQGLSPVWGGKLYGLPIGVETLATFYNKDIFDKFGVAYPKDGLTWDDVYDLNNKLTRVDQGTSYAGLVVAPAQHFSLNALSLPYYDMQTGKSSVVTDEAKWRTIYEAIAVRPMTATGYKEKTATLKALPGEANFYKTRDAAMEVGLVHIPLSYDMKDLNWDLTTYPSFKETPGGGAQANLLLFGVTNMSKNKDAAMEVIKYLYSDEYQTLTARDGNYPVIVNDDRIKQFAQNTYYKDRNVQSVFKVKLAPLSKRTIYDPDLAAIYRKYLTDLSLGNMDMNTMMRKVDEEVQQKVAEIKSR